MGVKYQPSLEAKLRLRHKKRLEEQERQKKKRADDNDPMHKLFGVVHPVKEVAVNKLFARIPKSN